jgi:hypothetical protein
MDDFALKLEVHLAMPIRDIMNVFILGNDSFLLSVYKEMVLDFIHILNILI